MINEKLFENISDIILQDPQMQIIEELVDEYNDATDEEIKVAINTIVLNDILENME